MIALSKVPVLLYPLFFFTIHFSVAQTTEQKKDTTATDVPPFIERLHRTSLQHEAEWLFNLIFKLPELDSAKTQNLYHPYKKGVRPIHTAEGKIIQEIEIIVIDPFGPSIDKPSRQSNAKLAQLGNQLHILSRKDKIRKTILLSEGDKFDEYKAEESERLLRTFNAVKDVRFETHILEADSIKLIVLVHDYWSILPSAELHNSGHVISLKHNNLLGYHHQAGFRYKTGTDSLKGNSAFFTLENLNGQFHQAEFSYGTSLVNRFSRASFTRNFYSPLTLWSYGLSYQSVGNKTEHIPVQNNGIERIDLKYRTYDAWISRSLALDRINPGLKPHQRLVVNMGITSKNYFNNSEFFKDSIRLFYNENLLLAGIGYSSREYYRDTYIYGFGEYEDVKEGFLLALVGGRDLGSSPFHSYGALNISSAKHITQLGHFSAALHLGGYIHRKKLHHGVLDLGFSWFGNRYNLGQYKIRHFVYAGYLKGIRRQTGEFISLSGEYGLYGYDNPQVLGTQKAFINLENVCYLPQSFWGFQLGVLAYAGMGLIGDNSTALLQTNVYQVYGLGFIIKNQYLQMGPVRISFGFYPRVGDVSQPFFKFNPIKSYNLRFRDLQFSRPELPQFR